MFKKISKKILPTLIFLIIFGSVCYLLFSWAFQSKTPATAEQVWDVMIAQGHTPYDVTEQYYKNSLFVKKCIAFQEDDLHFQFLILSDKSSADGMYIEYISRIRSKTLGRPQVEHHTSYPNFGVYTVEADGKYYVSIFVENTAIYAYCDAENMDVINDIRRVIGYVT